MTIIYEKVANEVVPAIRIKLANILIDKYSMQEKKVAEILGVAQAAVSKYRSGKYSEKIKRLEKEIDNELVEKYAKVLFDSGKEKASEAVCTICQAYTSFRCGLAQK